MEAREVKLRKRVQKLRRLHDRAASTRLRLKERHGKNPDAVSKARIAAYSARVRRLTRKLRAAEAELKKFRNSQSEDGFVRVSGGARATVTVAKLVSDTGITTNGPRAGLRTYEEQLELWNAYQNGTGSPAFPPWGDSKHLIRNLPRSRRHALDIPPSQAPRFCALTGYYRPYSYEAWHVQPR